MKKLLYLLILITAVACGSAKKSQTSAYRIQPDLSNVTYGGRDGSSIENAVVVNANNETSGIAAEYKYIANKYGKKNEAWRPAGQSTFSKNGKQYDHIKIKLLPGNGEMEFYFDITKFYGKF